MDKTDPAAPLTAVPYSNKRVTKVRVSEFSMEITHEDEGTRVPFAFSGKSPCPCEDEEESKLEQVLTVLKQAAPVILDKLNQILAANGLPTGTPPFVERDPNKD